MATDNRVNQQLRVVERLLQEYQQGAHMPLSRFLTTFYKHHRQMGARDRRMASRLAYHYFRIGHAARQADFSVRLGIAEFLCSEESALVQQQLPALYPAIGATITEKIALLETHTPFHLNDVFPFTARLSQGVDAHALVTSLFMQPKLFIRLRRGHEAAVMDALEHAGISYERVAEHTLALSNGTALEQLNNIAGNYAVQDYSSQQTSGYFLAADGESWWDACAGAGGKSLLLLDNYPGVKLLVSDVRGSILRNLDERFEQAGIGAYRRKIIDLTKDITPVLGNEQFDGIILDAPCTGSGTWGRTPEMISSFDERSIDRFAAVQKQVAETAAKHLKPGKPLIYITCSVFAEENEKVVGYLQDQCNLELERMQLLPGYPHQADSLFVARLIKR
ncbi:RsmB/NOP family class I SAM-dependent RNA methyltransferase [Parapedobacter sp. DT-150]|uniref:RsmB/NOP family class I SAM-dependent RNA methyltransferase n=1 Tax=Parapedobacter sp. DT-150 TaxID=3396162 RepID=UPI003F1B863B